MRQVTHALLTRPPLSHNHLHPEGFGQKCFVRLACIKHAASVHPEQGSNSRIDVYRIPFYKELEDVLQDVLHILGLVR